MVKQLLTEVVHGQDPKWLLVPVVVIGLSILICLIDYLIIKFKRRNKNRKGKNNYYDLIFLALFLGVFYVALTRYGIILCKKDDYLGVFVLFVTLNIFGLVLGWAILSNNKKILFDKIEKFLDKKL